LIDGGRANKETLVEELEEFTSFPGRKDARKVCIIEEVQELHDKAKNAMLKILERVDGFVHFVLLTMDDPKKGGFNSRSTVFRFFPLKTDEIAKYLYTFSKQNGIPLDKEKLPALWAVAQSANGSIRDAIQNYERVVDTDMWDEHEIFREMGALDDLTQNEILLALCDGKCDDKLFSKLLEETDFDKVFKFNYSSISAADALNEFDVSTGIAYVKNAAYDSMTDKEKQTWESLAERRAFAMKEGMTLLARHPNFPLVRDLFRKACASFNMYSEDLKKSDYILMLCEIARTVKGNTPAQTTAIKAAPKTHFDPNGEQPAEKAVRRVAK
jgi:DNA polymerase III delta prime subunit